MIVGSHFPIPHSDAVVVLGSCRPLESVEETLDERVRRAARYYTSGTTPLLVLTGGNTNYNTIEQMRERASSFGIPESAMIAEPLGRDILGSAYFTRLELTERGVKCSSLDVITHEYNGSAAGIAFRSVFSPEVGIGVSIIRRENVLRRAYDQAFDLIGAAICTLELALIPQGNLDAVRINLMLRPRYYGFNFGSMQKAA